MNKDAQYIQRQLFATIMGLRARPKWVRGALSRLGYRGGFNGLRRSCLLTEYRGVLSGVFYIKRNRHPYLNSFNAGTQLRFATS